MKARISDAVEAIGMGAIAWGLYGVAHWAGIIAGGVFIVIIGAALGVKT